MWSVTPRLAITDRIHLAFPPNGRYPGDLADYTDGATPIVYYQLEGVTGNGLRILKSDAEGRLLIGY